MAAAPVNGVISTIPLAPGGAPMGLHAAGLSPPSLSRSAPGVFQCLRQDPRQNGSNVHCANFAVKTINLLADSPVGQTIEMNVSSVIESLILAVSKAVVNLIGYFLVSYVSGALLEVAGYTMIVDGVL